MTKYYLRMEGRNLSNQDLSAIRDGGLLLSETGEKVESRLKTVAENVHLLTTGASFCLFEFDADNGEFVRTEIERFLNDDQKFKHASFVVDIVEAGEEKDFSKKEEKLIALNRYRQIKSPCITVPPHEYECLAFHEINIISKLPGNNDLNMPAAEEKDSSKLGDREKAEEYLGKIKKNVTCP